MPMVTGARVVVADDSALMRTIVAGALERAGLEVVGSARNGDEALALCEREQPDALTLDLTMPGLDGLGVLSALQARRDSAMPVIVVSAFSASHGARAVDALARGAFDLVSKPASGDGLEAFRRTLGEKVALAITSRHRQRAANGTAARLHRPQTPSRAQHPTRSRVARTSRLVLIATSTGGPRALAAVMPHLPCPLGAGTLIVQHMPAGFTGSLAARLNADSRLEVREAAGGELLNPRTALVAPGGRHLRLAQDGRTSISDEPAIGGLRPRADLLIEDAARIYGDRLLLVVLTGMGNDGLRGAREVRRRGGTILVEAEETTTVYGMPRAIVEARLADEVLALGRIPSAIAAEAA